MKPSTGAGGTGAGGRGAGTAPRAREARQSVPGFRKALVGRFRKMARSIPCDPDGWARVGGRNIYILPTGTGLLFAGVLMLMLLGSLNYQNNLGLLFTFLMGSVALVGMHHTWFNLRGLRVCARGGAPVFAGEEAGFLLSLSNPGSRHRGDLGGGLDGAPPTGGLGLAPESGGELQIRIAAAGRGRLQAGRIGLQTRWPLGLFRAWCYVMTPAEVIVYPAPVARGPAPLFSPAYRHSSKGDRGVGADDFVGLRGYRAGDSPRQLDWKAYGRERGLVVKQFGGDRADQVWLDWDALPPADLETRLSLLCRQILDAAEQDLTFGLRLPEKEIPMGRGDSHKHLCLQAIALFQAE